jgi:DNA-binding SARP family transcriptional activator/Tfp pilus assembly protein PilF
MISRGPDPSPADQPTLQVRVLGGFEVVACGRRLTRADWQRVSAERFVKLLLVTPGHRLSREIAAETLWPGAEPEASRANLRKALHFANHALRGTDTLIAVDGTVALDPERLGLDLDHLQAAFDLLAANTADDALDGALETVLQLGSRDLLPDDAFEDWLVAPRERLRSRWERIAMRAARRARETGRTGDALEVTGQLLERDPTDEAAHRLAIELYAADGRHHAARRQFELCRQALRDGLDADPSDETVDAFRAAEQAAARTQGRAIPGARLVARQQELEQVEPLLDIVAAGRLASLVICGPAGIGKTRLLEEVAAYARAAGWRVLDWRAVEAATTLAYAPLRIALADALTPSEIATLEEPARSGLATLIPGFDLGPPLKFEDRSAFVAALVQLVEHLARSRPLVVAIDDLPWLDPSSLELLGTVVAGLADAPILVAATHRDHEPTSQATSGFLDQLRRAGGLELRLGPLALRDIEPLIVGHLGGETVQSELAHVVHERSLGNPLFCLELVRAGRDRGALRLGEGRWSLAASGLPGELPDTVRTLVASRSAALPAGARELLATAAELGPMIEFDTLAAVRPDHDADLLASLDAALASGLLVEDGNAYAFAHPLYRLAVRGAWGPRRRGEACLAIAWALAGPVAKGALPEALERAAADHADPATVAEQALSACELGVGAARPIAAAFGFAAGQRETRLFDRGRAAALLSRALDAWRRLPAGTAARFDASAAHVLLADLHMTAGEDAAATRSFRDAIATARGPEELARAYASHFWLPYRHGDFETALTILQEGLGRLPPETAASRARIQASIGWCLVRLRRFDEALVPLEEAVRVLEGSEDRQGAMRALDFLGVLLRHRGRADEGVDCLERSLALAFELSDSRGEMLAQIHVAAALTRSGHPERARPHSDRGLELATLTGDRYAEAVAAWGAAEMEELLGDLAAAVAYRLRELRLLASIGGNAHNEALAHAHLAHLARTGGDDATFALEAETALRLARQSDDADYHARIQAALEEPTWSRQET